MPQNVAYLPQPLILLGAVGHFDFEVVSGGARRKLVAPPTARLAHFAFFAQTVELKDQARILNSLVVAHRSPQGADSEQRANR